MEHQPANCPNCGSDELSWGYSAPPFQWQIECHEDGCGTYVVADNEDEAFSLWRRGKWTARIIEWDEDGMPCEFEFRDDGATQQEKGG